MSSTESAQIAGSELSSEKNLKESNRFMSSAAQVRSVSTQNLTRLSAPTTYTSVPALSGLSLSKQGVHRVPLTTASGVSLCPLSKPVLTVASTVNTCSTYVSSTYHVPRGPAQVASIAAPRAAVSSVGRTNVTLQPVQASCVTQGAFLRTTSPSPVQQNTSWVATQAQTTNVIPVPRGSAPRTTGTYGPRTITMTVATHPHSITNRTLSSSSSDVGSGNCGGKQILLHSIPQKPLQGNQLHTVGEKTLKVAAGTVTQVVPVRPPTPVTSATFVSQNQTTTILQGSSSVLTTPVRLSVPSCVQQPQMIATQRVASRITQAGSLTNTARITTTGINQGAILATTGRIHAGTVSSGTTVLSAPARLVQTVTGQNAIVATPARITTFPGTPILAGQPAVIATGNARLASTGATLLTTTTRPSPVPATQSSSRPPAVHLPANSQYSISSSRGPTSSSATSITTTTTTLCNRYAVTTSVSNNNSRLTPVTINSGITIGGPLLTTTTNTTTTTARLTQQQQSGATSITLKPLAHSANRTCVTSSGQKVIQLPTPTSRSQQTTQSSTQSSITTVASKQTCYSSVHTVTSRPVAVVGYQPTQVAKLMTSSSTSGSEIQPPTPQNIITTSGGSGVYIQTHRATSSPGLMTSQSTMAPTLSTYTLPAGASFYYEAPHGYQLATDAPLVARPLATDTPLVSRQISADGPLISRPYTPGSTQNTSTNIRTSSIPSHGLIATSQTVRYNPLMIVESGSVPGMQQTFTNETGTLMLSDSSLVGTKLTSSPRPSILRKRENEGPPAKASKNLTPLLSSASVSRSSSPSPPSLQLETTHQHSNDNGPSSNGSTTISATSSPGLEDTGDSSMPLVKTVNERNDDCERPNTEMSPRKKPRKQQLNDANDSIDMEFIPDDRLKKEGENEVSTEKVSVLRRPYVTLMSTYRHPWRTRHNHFMRTTDVRSKEDRRPMVTELANKKSAYQDANGWKIAQLTAQMDDFTGMESELLETLSTMLSDMERDHSKDLEKEINRVNDLIMGTIQRSKVIKDQMQEARTQVMKLFDHKVQVKDMISRYASKRNCKKKEKY